MPTRVNLDKPKRYQQKFCNEEILDLPLPSSIKPSNLELNEVQKTDDSPVNLWNARSHTPRYDKDFKKWTNRRHEYHKKERYTNQSVTKKDSAQNSSFCHETMQNKTQDNTVLDFSMIAKNTGIIGSPENNSIYYRDTNSLRTNSLQINEFHDKEGDEMTSFQKRFSLTIMNDDDTREFMQRTDRHDRKNGRERLSNFKEQTMNESAAKCGRFEMQVFHYDYTLAE